MRNTFVAALAAAAEANPNLWLLCGDLGFSVLEPFAARFPDRFVNIGVAEQNMAGVAAGLALSGKTVFVYSIGNFPTLRCLEQIRNDVCYHGADVKIVAVGGGYAYGSQGYTHHALEDVAVMATLPGMEVFVPCDPVEARVATEALARSGRPSYLRLSRSNERILHRDSPIDLHGPLPLRTGVRRGARGTAAVLASGPIAGACMAAADTLASEGLHIDVASVPCLKPLDAGALRDIAGRFALIVTVEEHILRGGLYAAVAAELASVPHHPPVLGIGIPEPAGKPSTAGDREALLAQAGLSAEAIAGQIRSALIRLDPGRSPGPLRRPRPLRRYGQP